jgi:GNAT superfamily N-acetyltransferase
MSCCPVDAVPDAGEHLALRDGAPLLLRTTLHPAGASVVATAMPDRQWAGIARYDLLPGPTEYAATGAPAAELVVSVASAWQGRGLGTVLVRRLAAQARAQQIYRFTMAVRTDNAATLALLRVLNAEVSVVDRVAGQVRYLVALQAFCELCGKSIDWPSPAAHARRVCDDCVRAYLPKIQARLAEPWWC